MLLATGWLDSSGTPRLCINISGPQSERKEFNGVIDTGFDGFITMPEQVSTPETKCIGRPE